MTLTQVSESSGLSVPFLSQVENNRAKPSLQSLAAIAKALSCNTIDIMAAAKANCVVDVLRRDEGGGDRRLTPVAAAVRVDEITRDPGAGESWQAYVHELVLYVVRGTILVDVHVAGVDERHELEAGDRLLCGGGAAYRWETAPTSAEPAVVIAVHVDDRAHVSSVDLTPPR